MNSTKIYKKFLLVQRIYISEFIPLKLLKEFNLVNILPTFHLILKFEKLIMGNIKFSLKKINIIMT